MILVLAVSGLNMNIIAKSAIVIVGLSVFISMSIDKSGKSSENGLSTASSVEKITSQLTNNIHGSGCRVTFEAYNNLHNGMSYPSAVRVLGCEGREMSRSDMAGYSTVMVAWDGQGMVGANMNAMFQNGQMVMKAQFGLK